MGIGPLIIRHGPRPSRCADVQPGDAYQIAIGLDWRAPEQLLAHAEIAGQGPSLVFRQLLGAAPFHELLHIGRIASEQAREARIILSPLVDQAL